jgi:hypothetical protein
VLDDEIHVLREADVAPHVAAHGASVLVGLVDLAGLHHRRGR